MKKQLAKLIIGATLIAIILIIISQLASAIGQTTWPRYDSSHLSLGKYHFKGEFCDNGLDGRTSKEKYYYDYPTVPPVSKDASSWGNKRVYNHIEYQHSGRNETYTDNYYYKPRYNSQEDHYNWRF